MCFFKCCDNLAYGDGDHYRVKKIGSISVSGQLPTHPSPNPTLTLTCCQLTIVELGEGQVGSCHADTDIDPKDIEQEDQVRLKLPEEQNTCKNFKTCQLEYCQ